MKFKQQPVLWCQRLLGVRTGIIEQRVAGGESWHWEQTDVAIIKKYTTSELNMKCGGSKNEGRWWLCFRCSANEGSLLHVEATLLGQPWLWWRASEFFQIILLSEKGIERCYQNPSQKKKQLSRRQLLAAYCIFIMQEQRGSGRSMLCQSVLKHLRHSSSVMKSVEKRGIWQNVLRTLFYHKCFVSQSFSQGCSLTRNYKSVWIFDGRRKLFLSLLRAWDKLRFLIR